MSVTDSAEELVRMYYFAQLRLNEFFRLRLKKFEIGKFFADCEDDDD